MMLMKESPPPPGDWIWRYDGEEERRLRWRSRTSHDQRQLAWMKLKDWKKLQQEDRFVLKLVRPAIVCRMI